MFLAATSYAHSSEFLVMSHVWLLSTQPFVAIFDGHLNRNRTPKRYILFYLSGTFLLYVWFSYVSQWPHHRNPITSTKLDLGCHLRNSGQDVVVAHKCNPLVLDRACWLGSCLNCCGGGLVVCRWLWRPCGLSPWWIRGGSRMKNMTGLIFKIIFLNESRRYERILLIIKKDTPS